MTEPAPVSRFALPHPQQFGQGKVGEWWIAGQINQLICPKQIAEFVALLLGSLIAPDDRRSDNLIICVEQDCTMHLSREPDTGNGIFVETGINEHLPHCNSAGSPPILRRLLRPTRLRNRKRLVVRRRGRQHLSTFNDYYRTGSTRPDINPHLHSRRSSAVAVSA